MKERELLDFALGLGGRVLEPFGARDCLLYYSCVAGCLEKFLSGKPLAVKNLLPPPAPTLLKRGSLQKPIFCGDLPASVDLEFLKKRAGSHLKQARGKISAQQELLWKYFLPRKLGELLYATNGEGEGKALERVFIDIDRGKGVSIQQACGVAKKLAEEIGGDSEFNSVSKKFFVSKEPFVNWTGSSFHFFFFLKKGVPARFYREHFQYDKRLPEKGFCGKWARSLQKDFAGLKIVAGHEKLPKTVSIDPSQTPSGKLCRAPFSLHLAGWNEVDGVSVPVKLAEFLQKDEKELVGELTGYSPAKLLGELASLQKLLPTSARQARFYCAIN